MIPVVIELQQDALNRDVRVSDLLRKALVVAHKLKLNDFQKWIEKELKGYGFSDDIPDYREVFGQLRGWNPFHGWVPIIFQDSKYGEKLSKRKTNQSIPELVDLIGSDEKNTKIHMPFSQEMQRLLCKGLEFETEINFFVSRTSIVGIVETVRTIILNWALKLEDDSILGEGLSFSLEEKEAAQKSTQNITNFYGPVQSPQIQQGSPQSIQIYSSLNFDINTIRKFITNLKEALDSLEIITEDRTEVNSEVRTLEAQIDSPKPKTSIIRESLLSIQRILKGASGVAASQLLIELGKLIFCP